MSEPKGPKLDLPEDLVAEITQGEPEDSSSDIEADIAAASEDAGDDPGEEGGADEVAQWKDKYLRLAAEFQNFKRRALKEHQDLLNFATEGLMKELLGTIDNLERALGYVQQDEDLDKENMLEGVELTLRSLLQTLEKGGLKVIEAQGVQFDPAMHEAIRQVPSDEHETGTVIEVFQKGYMLKNRLLRPALVSVVGG